MAEYTINKFSYGGNTYKIDGSTPFTTEVDGLVPGPDSSLVVPGSRYTDDYNTSKYWLNAMGDWQTLPEATVNQEGTMHPSHYQAVYILKKRGYWRESSTVSLTAYTWTDILTGIIPANDTSKTILYKCTATTAWSTADDSTWQFLAMWHTNEDGTGGGLHDRTAFKVDYNNIDYHREYTYFVTQAAGSPAWQMHLMAQANKATSLTWRTMLIEAVAWT